MARSTQDALVIFARRPAGRVKTRLVPPLTRAQALDFHLACLESILRLAASLPRSGDPWLYFTPGGSAPLGKKRVRVPARVRVRTQRGRDLGGRLRRALAELLAGGYRRVVFIGSDSPTLTPGRLRQAFVALRRADAVLGPARDGGFYLIGLRVEGGAPPAVFRGIAWGTPRAFRQMRARLRATGLRTMVLPLEYDVDLPADLVRLRRDLRKNRRPQLAPLRAWFAGQEKKVLELVA
ncbi:TIGR04282 family arsenosugar biosynthesis glycosyltransferase [Acidobacteriia bacterium AH_259_A11_L15]|nr:TIGR04282 family arsenosugar biosynthesis glycosyltransferase [Acidobacteriia bacterium AH_259_A11_L15]